MRSTPLVLLLLLLLAGISIAAATWFTSRQQAHSGSEPPGLREAGATRIRARVVDGAGRGVPEIGVTISSSSVFSDRVLWKCLSDAEGMADFAGIEAGTYRVALDAESGAGAQSRSRALDSSGRVRIVSDPTTVNVTKGMTARVILEVRWDASLKCRVTDEHGTPVEGCDVQILAADPRVSGIGQCLRTGSGGWCHMQGIPAGRHWVKAFPVAVPSRFRHLASPPAQILELGERESRVAEITLGGGRSVLSVRAVDGEGRPLPLVWVRAVPASREDEHGNPRRLGFLDVLLQRDADAQGCVRLEGLPAIPVEVMVAPSHFYERRELVAPPVPVRVDLAEDPHPSEPVIVSALPARPFSARIQVRVADRSGGESRVDPDSIRVVVAPRDHTEGILRVDANTLTRVALGPWKREPGFMQAEGEWRARMPFRPVSVQVFGRVVAATPPNEQLLVTRDLDPKPGDSELVEILLR